MIKGQTNAGKELNENFSTDECKDDLVQKQKDLETKGSPFG